MPSQKSIPISELITTANSELLRLDFKRSALQIYCAEFRKFSDYYSNEKIQDYTATTGREYFQSIYGVNIASPRLQLTKSQSATRRAIRLLDDIFQFGYALRYCHRSYTVNPEYDILLESYLMKCRKKHNSQGTLRTKQMKLCQFFEYIEGRNIQLACLTLADIRMRDVRLDSPAAITLHGKGGKVRTVPLMKQTVELLQSYFTENGITPQKSPDMPLFWSGNYRKLTRSGITYIVQKYAAAAQAISTDIPATISPHVFRHTKAMHLVQANVNTVYIKDYLGHADISTTEVYARADNEAKRAALEKASLCLELPCASNWEQDADLIAWLLSLG